MPLPRSAAVVFRLGLAAAVAAVTALATLPLERPPVPGLSDKANHLLAFWVLGFLADFAWPERGFDRTKAAPLFAYGVGIEFLQLFLPHRTFSVPDVVADAAGLAAYGLCLPLLRRLPVLRKRWPDAPSRRKPAEGSPT